MKDISGDAPPFFIVGCDRSGTTMLRLILDRHPQVAIPTESMFITDFLERLPHFGDLSIPAHRLKLARAILNYYKVQTWKLPLSENELAEAATDGDYFAAMVRAVFLAYARKEGKTRWGDKTPYYVHRVDALKTLFPDARVIHLVRDGRDVALSLIGVGFGPTNVYAAACYWKSSVRQGRRAVERYAPQTLEIRYEDLVRDPVTLTRRVCDFLELEFHADMLHIEESHRLGKFAPKQEGWFAKVAQGINTTSVNRWSQQMTPRQQSIFQEIAGDELEEFGYDRVNDLPPIRFRRITLATCRMEDLIFRTLQWIRLHVMDEHGSDVGNILRRHVRRLLSHGDRIP